mgnify:FL=1
MEDILELERHYIETHNLQADWDHWVQMPSWQVNEGVLLINDLEPSIALTEGLALLREGANKGFPSFVRVDKQFKVIERAMEDNVLSVRNPPLVFLNWCKRNLIIEDEDAKFKDLYFIVETHAMKSVREYKAQGLVSEDTSDEGESPRAVENRELIIYLLYKLLQAQNKNWTQDRVTQELIERFAKKAGSNKGLSETSLRLMVAKGKKYFERN